MLKEGDESTRRRLLLDTTILSARARKTPPEGLTAWLEEVSNSVRLCICFPVLIEIKRGLLLSKDAATSARIRQAIEGIEQTNFVYLGLGRDTEDVFAAMMATSELRNFWYPNPKQKHQRVSHDLMVAAVAIAYQTPILTTDGDFVEIDKHFKLPGVYNPLTDRWVVPAETPIDLPKLGPAPPSPHVW